MEQQKTFVSSMKEMFPKNAVLRYEWKAVTPKSIPFDMKWPCKYLYVSFTDTPRCNNKEDCSKIVQQLQLNHMVKYTDLTPNFIIGGDGNVYVARSWMTSPEIPPAYKQAKGTMLNFAIIGNIDDTITELEQDTLDDLTKIAIDNDFLDPLHVRIEAVSDIFSP